jgi:hypothetical protein
VLHGSFMSFSLSYKETDGGYFIWEILETNINSDVSQTLDALRTACAEKNCYRILLMITTPAEWLSTADIYRVVNHAGLINFSHKARVAALRMNDFARNRPEYHEFISDILKNRGWNLQFFYEHEKAMNWLLSH